jgi:hypothetical protein
MPLTPATEKKFVENISKLTRFTGGYCLFFGAVLFLASLVLNPVILFGAVLHLITGLLFLLFANGIKQRSQRGILGLTLFAATLAAASFIAILNLTLIQVNWNIPALIGLTIFLVINLQLLVELFLWKRLHKRLSATPESESQAFTSN